MADDRNEDEERSFLGRWSQRKRDAARGMPKDQFDDNPSESAGNDIDPGTEEGINEQEAIEKANREAAEAVDLESLTYNSDFSVFLKIGVPAALKRAAMRKLWTSNPVLANLDGLNDYDEDFNNPAHNVFQSIWQVGRGYLGGDGLKGQQESETKPAETESSDAIAEERDQPVEVVDTQALDVQGESEEFATSQEDDGVPETVDEVPVQRVSIRQRLKG